MDNKGFDGHPTAPTAPEGKFDFNTASTLELTHSLPETSKKQYDIEGEDFKKGQGDDQTSDFGALLHVVKSSLGSGLLASPAGFSNAGSVVGIVGTIIIGFFCVHCTEIMVRSSQKLCSIMGVESLGFGNTVEVAMETSKNQTLKRMAKVMKVASEGFMFFTYYGVTTVYVILVSETLKQVLENHTSISWDIRAYVLIISVPIFIVGMIRSLRVLEPFSFAANFCLFFGLIITLYFVFQDMPSFNSRPYFAGIERLPSFMAIVFFGMEGIGTMLPIENSMKKRNHFLGCPGVLNLGMVIVVGMFLLVGLSGYIRFGDEAAGSITLNLPNDIYSEVIKSSVALAIFLSYGLQLTAAIDVIWRNIEDKFSKEGRDQAYHITRAVLILSTIVAAVAVPNLGPVIGLVGAVGFSMCGFFFPALVDIAICTKTGFGRLHWILWKDIGLMIAAVAAAAMGSIVSVSDIIKEYH